MNKNEVIATDADTSAGAGGGAGPAANTGPAEMFNAGSDQTSERTADEIIRELTTAKEAAERVSLAKSDFLMQLSHELRTPLHVILGFAQLIESGVPPPAPSQQKNLEQIMVAGRYLLELSNQVLDRSLIESGKVTLSHEAVSLGEVMDECRKMIEPQAQRRRIAIAFPRFETACFVKADRTRLKQVLMNLLLNAIKYNKPGGAVTVKCSQKPSQKLRICVRDTGTGLSPELLLHLFQPFNRLGQEAGQEEGAGIGLVVAKQLVEIMGGAIGAESAVGEGSMFWIELKTTSAPQLAFPECEAPAVAPPPLAAGTPVRTVLYVEDNPANLELVRQLLARRPGLRLLTAIDGIRGIEAARTLQPDVILMDINMPGMSGIEALAILRADPSTAHMPVMALSANAMPRDIEKGLVHGFYRYITKPIKVNEFMLAVDDALLFSQTTPGRAGR